MAHRFAEHSPYAHLGVDEEKTYETVNAFLSAPKEERIIILAIVDDKPVGMLAGMISELLINRMKIASEVMWWMDPEYRGSRVSLELLDAYEFWATKCGANVIQLSTVETEQAERIGKLYNRRGYKLTERGYIKDI